MRNGAPYSGGFTAAVVEGGRVEICGEVLLNNTARLTRSVEVIGLTPQATVFHTASAFGFNFADEVQDVRLAAVRVVAHASSGGSQMVRVREATLTLEEVVMTGFRGGAAVEAALSTASIARSSFIDNQGGPALYLDRSDASLTDVVFEDNATPNGSLIGGAITASLRCEVTCLRCTFVGNAGTHRDGGGAVYLGRTPGADWGIGRFTARASVWGTGPAANTPNDIVVWFGGSSTGHVIRHVAGDIRCQASSSGNTCTAL